MKILLEIYLAENLGDDLFLKMILERYPKVTWYIFCQKKAYDTNFLKKYKNVRLLRLPHFLYMFLYRTSLLEKYQYHFILKKLNLDAVINIGGSIFMEIKGWEKLYNRRRFIWRKFKSKDKKSFVIGSNFGPYNGKEFVQKYSELFSYVDDVCFRDLYSYSLFNKLDNVRMEPDMILALEKINIEKKRGTIGISVINLKNRMHLFEHSNNYIDKMVEIVEFYEKKEYQVTLISFCKEEGDEEAINEIIKKSNSNKIGKLFYDATEIENFLNQFASFEKIIACRFHSAILSYVFQNKFYPLIYSKKTSDTLMDYKLANIMTKIEDIQMLNLEQLEIDFDRKSTLNTTISENAENHFLKIDAYINEQIKGEQFE
ncbi:polysaccharide pyruvyl transferase family protein [Paenibacillus camerounensis]|uniref:polysaccharide pyruvyl transferase family protein n=1 Tax=Paenibacillus camerounensis TaxID=1243663 RepID=UPI0005A667EA|nr:polysaccharide pyruvyl transferase family protein [Paenibacillus camerounensis]